MGEANITCPGCKKSFKGRDDLQGKRVKCPACGHGFVVEASAAAPSILGDDDLAVAMLMKEDAATAKAVAAKRVADKVEDDEEDDNPLGIITINIAARCPHCANQMASEDAIVCLFCGYNTQTRTHGETKKAFETTGFDWAKWTLPGVSAAVLALVLALLQMLYVVGVVSLTRGKDWWVWSIINGEATHLWITMMALGAIWALGKFAFYRLVVEPVPPENVIE